MYGAGFSCYFLEVMSGLLMILKRGYKKPVRGLIAMTAYFSHALLKL
jgi:hypothetical protein